MGFFSKILDKLGLDGNRKAQERGSLPQATPEAGESAATPTTPAAPGPVAADAASAPGAEASRAATAAPAAAPVDVAGLLEQKAAENSQKLNWRTSIVDLLKLLDLDSSLQARKELATELGCPPAQMADSAQMNMWLHKAVMRKLADNGGKVPAELLD